MFQLMIPIVAIIASLLLFPSLSWEATIQTPLFQPNTSQSATEYQEGVAALTNGNLERAQQAFEATLEKFPAHVGAIIGLAEIGFKKGEPDVTESYIQQALEIAPKNALVYQIFGRHLAHQGRLEEAERAYEHAIELEPKLLRLRLEAGDFYLQRRHAPHKAIPSYQAALELDPSNPGAHFGLGSALAQSGNVDEAIKEFEAAGRLAPRNPLPFFALGRLHAQRKHYDQARQAFSLSLQAQPQFVEAYIGRGDALASQQQFADAIRDYEAALHLVPRMASLHVKIGLLHEQQHHFGQAMESFHRAIALDPRQPIALNNLAWLAVQQNGQLDKALRWAEQAVALAPTINAFQDTLGWIHWKRGELEKAAKILAKAATLKPEEAEIFYHLGVVEAERGQRQQAIAALTKALSINASFSEADDARQRLQALHAP